MELINVPIRRNLSRAIFGSNGFSKREADLCLQLALHDAEMILYSVNLTIPKIPIVSTQECRVYLLNHIDELHEDKAIKFLMNEAKETFKHFSEEARLRYFEVLFVASNGETTSIYST